VNSTFSKGKFEQELECNLAVFTEKTADVKADKDAQRPAKTTTITKTPGVTPGGNAKRGSGPRNPNQTEATQQRTGVDLTSSTAKRFGAGRGSQGGPTAEELALFNASRRGAGNTLTPQQQMAAGVSTQKLMGTRKYPWEASKQNQTTTIPTKNGQVVQDDNAGVNPRQRR
jgi:hypothetical protein